MPKKPLHKRTPERQLEFLDDVRMDFNLPRARTRTGKEHAELMFGEKLNPRMRVLVYCKNAKGHSNQREEPVETRLTETGLTEEVECPKCHRVVLPRGEPKRTVPRVDSGTQLEVKRI